MLNTSVAGINFKSCVMNAAVPKALDLESLKVLTNSQSSAVLIKSCTVDARPGNEEPRYIEEANLTLNSIGLANFGYKVYLDYVKELSELTDKPLFISVSGFNVDEYVEIVKAFQASDVALIELNLSCPNVNYGVVMGYDVQLIKELLTAVSGLGEKPIGVKLPPYLNVNLQKEVADCLNQTEVDFITTINTLGGGLLIDAEKEMVKMKAGNGFGGVAGDAVKPIALGNVRRFFQWCPQIPIIGVGGISSGVDVFEFILAGASLVQIGSCFMREDIDCFQRINQEFQQIVDQKGYRSLDDFKGKLQLYS